MTSPDSNSARWQTYRADAQRFFSRHPLALLVFIFALLFTLFAVMDALSGPSGSSLSFGNHVAGIAIRAGEVSIGFVLFQLWRWHTGKSRA